MQATLEQYAKRIQENQINPIVYYDGQKSGLVFDPGEAKTPLNMLRFGIWQLESGPFVQATGSQEYALIPVNANFRVECKSEIFEGSRRAGPFETLPEQSNALAVYIPRDCNFKIMGKGEMVFYVAPSSEARKPCLVEASPNDFESWGKAFWRRNVTALIKPGQISTNLVVGETYSPPGLWSGMPPHIHDKDLPEQGQSDHEEVYYHLTRYHQGDWGSFGVQMLFNNTELNKAYVIKNKTAVAIPGAAHSVVAGPVSDLVYIWGLAGKEGHLGMWDIPEYSFLRDVEKALDYIENTEKKVLSEEKLRKICAKQCLCEQGERILRSVLLEKEWRFV